MFFKDIPGHRQIKKRLTGTVAEGRVSHAQLFLGPEGNAKFALALAYARYINCRDRTTEDACGKCSSCIKFDNLAHPDLHFIYPVASTKEYKDPKSVDFIAEWRQYIRDSHYYPTLNQWYATIGIEKKQGTINAKDCSEINKKLSYKSYESEYKIMIIWMAERLYYAAAPKILKILEEPPDKTLFILISENKDQIVNTILSRTQIVSIPKIENDDLSRLLRVHTTYGENEISNALNIAEGSYNSALAYLGLSESEKQNFDVFRKWMRNCYKNDLIEIDGFVAENARRTREELKSFFKYGLKVVRSSMFINFYLERNLALPEDEYAFVKNISPYINPTNIHVFSGLFEEAHNHVERNANASVLLMDLSLKIMELFHQSKA